MNSDVIDLRPLIGLLTKRWKLIFACALLASLAALAFTLTRQRVYVAEATLAISPSRTEVQFDPRIQTLADYELVGGTLVSRRNSLVALMTSNEVMQAVLSEIGEELSQRQRSIEWLRDAGNVETAGDLINLEITYPDPDTAALIANTWIEQFERRVNEIYGVRGSSTGSTIAEQVNSGRERYDAAQTALEAYEAQDPVEVLQRELDATLAILESYQGARIAAQTKSANRNQDILDSYYLELVQIERWLADATALREQVAEDTGSTGSNLGNMLALVALRSRVFGGQQVVTTNAGASEEGSTISSSTNIDLQVDLSSPTVEEVTVRDVDALISALEQRRVAAQGRIDAFLDGLQAEDEPPQLDALNARIASLTAGVTALQGQIEAATAEHRELVQARDNAWETYQLLLSQQVEEQVASQTTSSEVRIADRAIVPEEPEGRGLIRNTVIAGALGAMVAAGMVLVRAWWREDLASAQGAVPDGPQVHEEREQGAPAAPGLPDTAST